MDDVNRIFSLFPDFIKEYIYNHGWESLRPIQIDAASIILESDQNLLLSASTASGKTEAAFFPIIADIVNHPEWSNSVSAIYIAPLKSLINDQFFRLDELLDMSGIPVTHWHGDVGASHKTKLMKNPSGILQITPESLESMLMNRSNDIPRIFGSLQYVVIDEVHALIGQDRGSQVICLLERIARLIGHAPRRIGLSATLGNVNLAAKWLEAGSGRTTAVPVYPVTNLHWRLGMEHFYIGDPNENQTKDDPSVNSGGDIDRGGEAFVDPSIEYLYDATQNTKALVFSNSREKTEYVTATMRQIARYRGEEDIFLIHHGNLSASLREDAEKKMKDESVIKAVTCATVTMELGIDIGRLERVCQVGASMTVSGFLQRLGRSGRRGNPPEMLMVFSEDFPLPNDPIYKLIPWEMLRAIAIVELYASERFIEPPSFKKTPLSLAFHQTLSILASGGERSPKAIADKVLRLPPFWWIDKDTYRDLLISMVNGEMLEFTETGGLIVGIKGEKLVNNFKFYAVFKDSDDYTVRCESEEIGAITMPPPVGERFALAGRVWEVRDIDIPKRLVFVRKVEGKMEISWPGDCADIHTKVLLAMRSVLFNGKDYAFLGPNAKERLENARKVAKNAHMNRNLLIHIGGQSYVLFPWLGTKSFITLVRFLERYGSELGISDISSETCYYIKFKAKPEAAKNFLAAIGDILRNRPPKERELIDDKEYLVVDKYDEYISGELLRKAYADNKLDMRELFIRFAPKEDE